MVSNDPWSPLAGGQDPSTVLGGNDAWGEPAAAVTGIFLQNIQKKKFWYKLAIQEIWFEFSLEKTLLKFEICQLTQFQRKCQITKRNDSSILFMQLKEEL